MGFIRKLEDFFAQKIEGVFSFYFSGHLQPVEIAKQLSREMERDRTVGVLQIYVPNQYGIYLSREDYERLAPYGQAIRDELTAFLVNEAKNKGYTAPGKILVDIFTEETIRRGKLRVTSSYTEPLPDEQEESPPEVGSLSDTQVFAPITLSPYQQVSITGLLTVIEGLDAGLKIDIGADRVNLGRRDYNELPVTDMNTSRLHAYIVYEEGSHILYDAQSLNGTYVNSQRVTRKQLKSGERIKIGNTVILYEVK
jgi:hypothetical protein